jgi:hypothetical protein
MMGRIMKTSLINSCKPDAKKKKSPIEYTPATDGGIKPWQGFR